MLRHNPLRTHLHILGHTAFAPKSNGVAPTSAAGYETAYHPGHGWHVHVHVLASQQTWADQAMLASAWPCVTGGHGTVVDIRDRDRDVRATVCRTLTYHFKPMNLAAWGPAQVADSSTWGGRNWPSATARSAASLRSWRTMPRRPMAPHPARPSGACWPQAPRARPAALPSPPRGSPRRGAPEPGNTRRAAACPHPIDRGPPRGRVSAQTKPRGYRLRNRASSVTHDWAIDGPVHKPSTARRLRQRPPSYTPDMRRAWNRAKTQAAMAPWLFGLG